MGDRSGVCPLNDNHPTRAIRVRLNPSFAALLVCFAVCSPAAAQAPGETGTSTYVPARPAEQPNPTQYHGPVALPHGEQKERERERRRERERERRESRWGWVAPPVAPEHRSRCPFRRAPAPRLASGWQSTRATPGTSLASRRWVVIVQRHTPLRSLMAHRAERRGIGRGGLVAAWVFAKREGGARLALEVDPARPPFLGDAPDSYRPAHIITSACPSRSGCQARRRGR